MIQDIEILNFQCLRSLHLPDLSRFNVISGKNNVGKTALLEALFIFHDRMKPDMLLKTLGWRGIPEAPLDADSLWAPFFHNLNLGSAIEIRLTVNGRKEEARFEFNPRYAPTLEARDSAHADAGRQHHVSTSGEDALSHALDISYTGSGGHVTRQHLRVAERSLRLDFEEEPDLVQRTTFLGARRREDPKAEANRLSRLIEQKREDLVEEFLSIMASVSDVQLSYGGTRPTIICDIGLPRLVPVGYVGDGMARLLTIVLAMSDIQGGVLLIDEIENGIHHSVQTAFCEAIATAARRFDCQVIATTHSYEFLQAAHAGLQELFEPEFRYIRLEQNGSETIAKTFSHEMLGTALAANLEVR